MNINIILTIILFIIFTNSVYNIIDGIKSNNYLLNILSGIQTGLIGILIILTLFSIL